MVRPAPARFHTRLENRKVALPGPARQFVRARLNVLPTDLRLLLLFVGLTMARPLLIGTERPSDESLPATAAVPSPGPSPAGPLTDPAQAEAFIRESLLAHTPSLAPFIPQVALAAAHEVTVLLTGETGTGKTFLARLLHDCSPRRRQRFLVVPCGALAAGVIDSELFGHVKGSFTGATDTKKGRFAAAQQGTILLDEIDALGLEQQAKLLRVVETGEFEPVGSNATEKCQARILVASNWDMEEAVEHGKFRQDLYYRLNVFSFHLPALRERVHDIAPLAHGMLARFNPKFGKDLREVHADTLRLLETYPWPGNIRQLENTVLHAVLVSAGPELLPVHLPAPVRDYVGPGPTVDVSQAQSLRGRNADAERALILRTLRHCHFSRGRTAQALGISRVALYRKMKRYGLMSACE
jgi:DNA-binding NtrC family response regulator